MAKCSAGECGADCNDGCWCWSDTDNPADCECDCEPVTLPANSRADIILKNGKEIPFKKSKRRIKVTPQARYNICAHGVPITRIARFLDKSLPNRILVPANNLSKNVTLSLKNKTFKQILSALGLTLKS